MPWWGWIVTGAALFASEVLLIDAEFYLVFLGVAALIVGAGQLWLLDLPVWAQWLEFAALAIVLLISLASMIALATRVNQSAESPRPT